MATPSARQSCLPPVLQTPDENSGRFRLPFLQSPDSTNPEARISDGRCQPLINWPNRSFPDQPSKVSHPEGACDLSLQRRRIQWPWRRLHREVPESEGSVYSTVRRLRCTSRWGKCRLTTATC